jgi:hypothetical protein
VKIGFRPFGGADSASSRLRVGLPIRYLNKNGIRSEVFDYKNLASYSIVIFQKAYAEKDIELASLLREKNIKVFFDLCDNHFYNPDGSPELAERAERLKKMVSLADEIIVSNEGLGELTGRPFTVIGDMLETSIHTWISRRILKPFYSVLPKPRLRLVWFGSSGSEAPRFGMIDLQKIIPDLNAINKKISLQLSVISNSKAKYLLYTAGAEFPTDYYQWNKRTFPYQMVRNDITLIPIEVNPFTFCKTNNRPVLSMLLGLPVIATRIPSYEGLSEFVLFENWQQNIERYATNPALREKHVQEGYHFIMKNFNNQVIIQHWIKLIEKYKADVWRK